MEFEEDFSDDLKIARVDGRSKDVVNDEFEEDFIYDHSVYSITEGRRVFSNDKYFGFPCFAHKEPKYKLKDCEAGKCQDFLSMTRVDRLRVANERTLCTLCLLHACRIRQGADSLCLFSKVVPKNIACKSCKSKNVDRNILLCPDHENNTPENQEAVRKFPPGCEVSKIELLFLTRVLNLEQEGEVFSLDNQINWTCAYAFDINLGKRVPIKDVEFKTQKNHGSMVVYPRPIEPIRSSLNLVSVLHSAFNNLLPAFDQDQLLLSPIGCFARDDNGIVEDDHFSVVECVDEIDHPSTLLLSQEKQDPDQEGRAQENAIGPGDVGTLDLQ
jgi:hypothetical protein